MCIRDRLTTKPHCSFQTLALLLCQGVLSSQPVSIGVSSTVTAAGHQQLAGLLRPAATTVSRPVHIGSVPSTLPGVQFISKPVQILQTSASSTPQLLSALTTTNQVCVDFSTFFVVNFMTLAGVGSNFSANISMICCRLTEGEQPDRA